MPEIRRHADQGVNFAFETTLAGKIYTRLIPQWQSAGYKIHLVFLGLHDADLAVARAATRVAQGGHYVPEDVVRRRFAQGWINFQKLYRPLADSWRLYDKFRGSGSDGRSGDKVMKTKSGRNNALTGLEPALRRARLRARQTAARTGTPVVIYRNGKIERRMVTGRKSKV